MATLRLGISFHTGGSPKKHAATYKPVQIKRKPSARNAYVEPYIFSADTLSFINTKVNRIDLPQKTGTDTRLLLAPWKRLALDLANAREDNVQIDIVQIGDSHIQAEMGTSRLREILQQKYGNGGRGLITAFKLAGTNQPVDYSITSENPVDSQVRLLKRPWPIKPGFTGIASQSNLSNRITYKNLKKEHAFNRARIFTSEGERFIAWPEVVDSARFYALPGERIFGIYTSNSHNPGVIYSTIGNNGACFGDYLLLDGFSEDVAKLKPRLIILAMGTNEGFSGLSDKQIEADTKELIARLRTANPDALFMLWTPMECHAKDSDGNFKIKSRVRDARDIILNVAKSEGIPVWDFYEVAGGYGSAQKWVNAGLMNPNDHVHLLNKGYRIQGELAAEALIDFLNEVGSSSLY